MRFPAEPDRWSIVLAAAAIICSGCQDTTGISPLASIAALEIVGPTLVLGELRQDPINCNRPKGDVSCRGQPMIWANNAGRLLPAIGSGSNMFGSAMNASGLVVGSGRRDDGTQVALVWIDDEVRDLGTFGGQWAHARDVNDRGEVVVAVGVDTTAGATRALLWTESGHQDIGNLGADATQPFAIGANGHVVGRSETTNGDSHAFIWHAGVLTALPPVSTEDGSSSVATVVNASGIAAGQNVLPDGRVAAVRWENATVEELEVSDVLQCRAAAINEEGEILIGCTSAGAVGSAYLWDAGTVHPITDATAQSIEVSGLGADGTVVGWVLTGIGNRTEAFRWHDGTFETLGTLGGGSSKAYAIGPSGAVVGQSNIREGDLRGFLWDGSMELLPTPDG